MSIWTVWMLPHHFSIHSSELENGHPCMPPDPANCSSPRKPHPSFPTIWCSEGFPNSRTIPLLLRMIFSAELKKVRETKMGMDNQECELGLVCVSMPLYTYSGSIIAGLSVFGDSDKMTQERIHSEIAPLLRAATNEISLHLGYEEA